MKVERKHLRVYVDREKYDINNPDKCRESIVTVVHMPTKITVIKRDKVQLVAFNKALKEIEIQLNKN